MPLQATSGAASYDAFGGGVAAVPAYIEEIFGTFLYTGNSSTQTITNGIDLAGEGGLVWIKNRSGSGELNHILCDSARGYGRRLSTNNTDAQVDQSAFGFMPAFTSSGFSFASGGAFTINESGVPFASWTFRKQPKFFDVVTYTGNRGAGSSPQTINHNLGSVPGCIIIKKLTDSSNWVTYHRSLPTPNNNAVFLNLTNAALGSGFWANTAPTSTTFTVGSDGDVNETDKTYVAYIFAHDAGGFGLTGTDNVISCGSFTTDGSGAATVSLGYEPQWLLVKATASSQWLMLDNMRGWSNGSGDNYLFANTSGAENPLGSGPLEFGNPTATGFDYLGGGASTSYIYIAIRRGPMKVPTTGTSVFAPIARTGTGSNATVNAGFPPDLVFETIRSSPSYGPYECDRLRGSNLYLTTTSTVAEADGGGLISFDAPTGNFVGNNSVWETSGNLISNWAFRRAPGFFDVVCYTGDGTASRNITHGLTVTPELIFAKSRSNTANWVAYNAFGNGLILNSTVAANSGFNFITSASATTFTPADPGSVGGSPNQSGQTYVAYLFASAPGVSKVFSYTGNGSSQTINCGFTGGARFVMVKRTDSTGNWMVVDTARGLVSAGDPTLYLNSTAAEVTGVDWIDPDNSGFIVNQEGTMNANVSSATYIGLAIA